MTRPLLTILVLVGSLAIAGCGASNAPKPAGDDPHGPHMHPSGEPVAQVNAITDYSVYDLGSEWWNQHGDRQPLESLAGKVQVISMVYTHCSYTCPRILTDMKRIEAQIDQPERLGFVLVSIDPERDSPDRLRRFAESTRLDPGAWTLLSGSDDDILELATLLGIKYQAEGENDFSHSNTLLVLDASGHVVYRQPGPGEELEPMLAAIRSALPTASLASSR